MTLTTAQSAPLDPQRGLAVIDVDEVLALFVQGFRRHLALRDVDLRMQSFSLFGSMFPAGSDQLLERDAAKAHLDHFFAHGCGEIEPAPGAADGLAALAEVAQVVILTNAPESARTHRAEWLVRHAMPYPLILNSGGKGPALAILAGRVRGPVMFVDDLLPNLDSAAEHAPEVARFQMVADPALRPMAPRAPARHRWIEDWPELVAVARTLFTA